MLRESPYAMIEPSDALEIILRNVRPLPREEVTLQDARGRAIALDVYADADLPASPRSAVDGYAVWSGDPATRRTVQEEITAGRVGNVRVAQGNASRIMTGAPLPQGADAVVMVEETEERNGEVEIHKLPRQGDNVHPTAMDLAAGQVVLAAGTRIGPAEVGLLATVGVTRVPVYGRPRVAVLATGDEVVDPGETPGPGMVRDSNSYALAAAAADAGAEVVWRAHGRDDEETLGRLLHEALESADVVLTSGGVSMGTRDLIKPLIERTATVHFGRISFKPGKPLTFATRDDGQLIFGLPGFPVSSLVTFEVFVRPALLRLMGRSNVLRPRVEAVLEHDVRTDPVRLEYQRATLRWESGAYRARTTGGQSSGRLTSIAGANALLEIRAGQGILAAGSSVPALLLDA